jgi:cytochrome c-type biogenesis protein
MIEALFITLNKALSGHAALALAVSFVWGIMSMVLSPCHLSTIPLIVGFIDEQGRISAGRAFTISLLFSLGLLASIAIIGIATALMGRIMGDVGPIGTYGVAFVFFLVGLHLLDIIPMPWSATGPSAMKRKGFLAALILGLIFGIALGPCTFAYMAPILTITFQTAASNPAYALALLLAYGVGHCSIIVLAGTSTELVQRYLNWNEASRGPVVVKKICGILVILGGLYLLYTSL